MRGLAWRHEDELRFGNYGCRLPFMKTVRLYGVQTNYDAATITVGPFGLAAPKAAARDSSGSKLVIRPSSARALIEARSAAIQAGRWESAAWWALALSSLAVVGLSLWR